MSDVYDIASEGWADCPDIPGWKIKAVGIDCGAALGVAIWNGVEGEGCKRTAVRIRGGTDQSEAIPFLHDWVNEKAAA